MDEREFRRELRRAVMTALQALGRELPEREFWGEVRRAALTLVQAIGKRYGYGAVEVVKRSA